MATATLLNLPTLDEAKAFVSTHFGANNVEVIRAYPKRHQDDDFTAVLFNLISEGGRVVDGSYEMLCWLENGKTYGEW